MPKTYLRYEPDDQFGYINGQLGSFLTHCGRFAVSVLADSINVRSLQTNQSITKIYVNKDCQAVCAAMHPTLNHLALGYSDYFIRVYDLDSQQELAAFSTVSRPTVVQYSDDGTVLGCGEANGAVALFDMGEMVAFEREIERAHSQQVTGMILKGQWLITASQDRLIVIYENLKRVQTIGDIPGPVYALAQVNDIVVAATDEPFLRLYSFQGERYINIVEQFSQLAGFQEALSELKYTPERFNPIPPPEEGPLRLMAKQERSVVAPVQELFYDSRAAGVFVARSKKALELFQARDAKDARAHQKQRVSRTVKQRLERVQKQLALRQVSVDGMMELQQLLAPVEAVVLADVLKPVTVAPVSGVVGARFYAFPNNPQRVRCLLSYQNTYHVYELRLDSNELVSLEQGFEAAFQHAPSVVVLAQEETVVMAADPAHLRIFSVRTCAQLASVELPENLGMPAQCVPLPGGVYCLITSATGLVCVINLLRSEVESLQQLHAKAVVFAELQAGMLVSVGEEGTIKYHSFRVADGQLELILEREIDSKTRLTCAAITADTIAIGCADSSVKIYYADTFKHRLTLYGHALPTIQITFSPTGERVFTLSSDKTLRSWGLTFGECLKIMKLREAPVGLALVAGTHIAFCLDKAGYITMNDLDSYIQICQLGEGAYGKRFSKGHFGAGRGIAMGPGGRILVTCGQDGCKTWLQSQDLVSVEDEAKKAADRTADSELQGKVNGWSGEQAVRQIDLLDKLQQTIETAFDKFQGKAAEETAEPIKVDPKTATQAELMRAALAAAQAAERKPWRQELYEMVVQEIPRSALPELMQALPVSVQQQLEAMLRCLLQGGADGVLPVRSEQLAWAYLRLVRTAGLEGVAETAPVLRQIRSLRAKASAVLGALRLTMETQ